ncbi:hypothetical protein [Aliivibrio wodanis]|uniref:hypothetical protein n=1 Tax=Aliivibrio wodanis TaxID=80852 RepID=UPI00406BEE07
MKTKIMLLIILALMSKYAFSASSSVTWVGKIPHILQLPEDISVKGNKIYWKENMNSIERELISNSFFKVENNGAIKIILLSL